MKQFFKLLHSFYWLAALDLHTCSPNIIWQRQPIFLGTIFGTGTPCIRAFFGLIWPKNVFLYTSLAARVYTYLCQLQIISQNVFPRAHVLPFRARACARVLPKRCALDTHPIPMHTNSLHNSCAQPLSKTPCMISVIFLVH